MSRNAAMLGAWLLPMAVCAAGRPPTAGHPATRPALPPDVRAALAGTTDFSLSFAQPGFYAVLRYVKRPDVSPEDAAPIEVNDWRALLERPADFRGLPVTIRGTVGRNKAWEFVQPEQRDLGRVWQLELWTPGQPLAATVILTDDAGDIPVGATIRVTGYFVMIRNYYGPSNRLCQAALLVGQAPTLISRTGPAAGQRLPKRGPLGIVAALVAGMVIVWLILRRSVARPPRPEALRARRPAPESLADDLAAWAAREPGLDQTEPPEPPAVAGDRGAPEPPARQADQP